MGDFKLGVDAAVPDYVKPGRKPQQSDAIVNHAKNQGLRLVGVITFRRGQATDAGLIVFEDKTITSGVAAFIAILMD